MPALTVQTAVTKQLTVTSCLGMADMVVTAVVALSLVGIELVMASIAVTIFGLCLAAR